MNDLKLIIAKNIATLRREHEMTQFELAEKLNYSDKAVSKWERGESVPDVAVLYEISKIFSVTVDYLLCEEHDKKSHRRDGNDNRRRNLAITCISILLVWLLAALLITILDVFPSVEPNYWFAFLYAVPTSCIVWLVFNSIWFSRRRNFLIISIMMWSGLLSIYISLLVFCNVNMRLLPMLGVPGQLIIWLWSRMFKNK